MAGRRRGTVKELSPGRWRVRISGDEDAKGKRDRLVKHVRGTKRDAEAELAKLLHEQDQGTLSKPSRDTLAVYMDRWLKEAAGPGMKPAAVDITAEYSARYIVPTLGAARLDRLSPLDVQGLYSALALPGECTKRGCHKCKALMAEGKRHTTPGLSSGTIRRVHDILRAALTQAVGWGLIPRNPAGRGLVKLPKAERPDVRFLTPGEAAHFLDASAFDRHAALWAFLLDTGCRPGEALAVRWQDLDLKAGTVRILRSLTWRTGSRKDPENAAEAPYVFTGTKTGKGRLVPLTPGLLPTLKAHRASQAEERLAAGKAWQALDLVFCAEYGSPHRDGNLARRHLKPILKAAELPDIGLYGLRHTCATMLLAAGVNPKVVSERLGHTSVRMTLDKYSHVIPAMQEAATSALELLLYRQAGSRS